MGGAQMNWHIGQEIVCIKTQSQGLVKRGRIYTIMGLQKPLCKCKGVDINVGIPTPHLFGMCSDCNTRWRNNTGFCWFDESLFAPLEYNQEAINELLEEPVLISLPAL
jgi:hypothetical protein